MESASVPYESPLAERVTRVEVEQAATKEDVKQINERLDRAARAAYFLGSAFLALAGTIAGTVLAG